MKTFLKAFTVLALVFLNQCAQKDDLESVSSSIRFSGDHSSITSSNANDRVDASELLNETASILVSIEDEQGNSIYELEKLEIVKSGDSYISDLLSLNSGNYKLTFFAYLDYSDQILAATPLITSALADYVIEPLPLAFSIETVETTVLNPEVIPITENVGLEEIGYLQFGYHPKIVNTFSIDIRIVDSQNLTLVDGDVIVSAGAGGETWNKTFSVQNLVTNILLKDDFDSYTFSVEKPGYNPSELILERAELDVIDVVSIYLDSSSKLVELSYDQNNMGYDPYHHSFEYDDASRIDKVYHSQMTNGYEYKTFTNYLYQQEELIPQTIYWNGANTQAIQFDSQKPIHLSWYHETNDRYTYDFILNYEGGLLTTASGRNTRSTEEYNQVYDFSYDQDGDLVGYTCTVDGDLLWEGTFEYYASDNVFPVFMIHDYVLNSFKLYANHNYEINNRFMLPWLIRSPKKLVKTANQHYYGEGPAFEKIEQVEFDYQFDENNRPITGSTIWRDMKDHPDVEVELRKDLSFSYE